MKTVRVLVALATVVAGLGAGVAAAGPPSEDIPVPGGTVALARAIGLQTPPDPSRFVAEIVRLTHGIAEGHKDSPSSTLNRLQSHLEVADRFRAVVAALPEGSVSLALAENRDTREKLKDLLDLLDLRLKEERGTFSVEPQSGKAAAMRSDMLKDLGLPLEGLPARLNGGESVALKLPTDLVPVPFTASWWSATIFRKPVAPDRLFAALVANPHAALLAHGLAALDDETLEYLEANPRLVERLADSDAPVFAAFANHLHVRDGRVVAPGGDAAMPLWEAAVGEKASPAEPFIRELFGRADGRLAYLYDLIGELDTSRAAFALGLWIPDDRQRAERFRVLVSSVEASVSDWQVRDTPFARPPDDVTWLLLNASVESNGSPRGLVSRRLWERVFESLELPADASDASKLVERAERDGDIDAAWLADAILTGDSKLRAPRLQQFALGARVFGGAPKESYGEVVTAIRALPSFPALILTLERAGVTEPGVYAAAARRALVLSELDETAAFVALGQFQGALAIVSTMAVTGGLEPAQASALVGSLLAVPFKDNSYGSHLVDWMRSQLLPALPPRPDGEGAEGAVIAGLAGASTPGRAQAVRVEWEGEPYRLDLAAPEERRLKEVRGRQRTLTIDQALQLESAGRELGAASIDLDGIQKNITLLKGLAPGLASWTKAGGKKAVFPAGVGDLPDVKAVVNSVVKDLGKITRPKDAKRANRVSGTLQDLAGVVLSDALGAMAYAVQLGNPTDGARLEADVSRRHDFGLGLKDKAERHWTPWLVPKQVIDPGVPRRVMGSLLALDVAFASLTLRRVSLEGPGGAPVLLSNDRETFTRSVALLNPHALTDADRDRIAGAVAKGRARLAAAVATDALAVAAVADVVKLDGWRRRAARWEMQRDPRRVETFFSVRELLALGSDATADLDAWGMSNTPVSGCLCTRLAPPNAWRLVMGRPQVGAMGTAVPDLNLQVAVMLSSLKLPAALAKIVLGAAVQNFVDRTRPNDPGDWLTLVRDAAVLPRDKVEDYVAAATARGPLVPDQGSRGSLGSQGSQGSQGARP